MASRIRHCTSTSANIDISNVNFQIVDDVLLSKYKIETDKRNWQDVVRLAFLRSWISCSLSGDMVLDLTLRVDFLMGPREVPLWCFDPCMKCFISLRRQIYKNEH